MHSSLLATDEKAKTEDSLWEQGKGDLEPAGITRAMFGPLNLWIEGQYHLGYCNQHLKASDVAHYRTWWEDTVVPTSEAGRYLLSIGTDLYKDGLKEGSAALPSLELCERTTGSWLRDMRARMEAVKAP